MKVGDLVTLRVGNDAGVDPCWSYWNCYRERKANDHGTMASWKHYAQRQTYGRDN